MAACSKIDPANVREVTAMINHQQREEIAVVSLNIAIAFSNHFGRAPDRRERDLLLHAVLQYFAERDAPSATTLQ